MVMLVLILATSLATLVYRIHEYSNTYPWRYNRYQQYLSAIFSDNNNDKTIKHVIYHISEIKRKTTKSDICYNSAGNGVFALLL